MPYHRLLAIPACQVQKGDRVLVYRNIPYNWFGFSPGANHNEVARALVVDVSRDPSDGEIYISTDLNFAAYMSPYVHIQLDCLDTFGKNGGET